MYPEALSAIVSLPYIDPVPRCASQWTTTVRVVFIEEGSMAEGVQAVQQGERLATTTPPMSPQPQRRGRRRTVWLVVLLLGGLAGMAAWQRLDLQSVWQRLGM